MSWGWSTPNEWALSGRVLRVVALPGRVLRVRICPVCGALIAADAREHHESVHRSKP